MKVLINILAVLLVITVAGCSSSDTTSTVANSHVVKHQVHVKQYTCPMDTDVVTNKPGVCPKCGMDLVEKENE